MMVTGNGQEKSSTFPHLIIPGPSSVQLSSDGSDNLCQAPLIGSVDVLVSLLDDKLSSCPFSMNLKEANDTSSYKGITEPSD